jgi:hypothetical protein
MAVAFRAASSANNASTASITVTMPTGTTSGDLLVAFVHMRALAGIAVYAPSGWTPLLHQNSASTSSSTLRMRAFYKIAASETDVTFTTSTGAAPTNLTAGVLAFSNPESVPIDVAAVALNGSSTSMTTPSVSPATAGLLVAALATQANTATLTAPGSMTEQVAEANSTNNKLRVATEQLSSSGATGTRTWTAATAGASAGMSVVLAVGAVTPTTTYLQTVLADDPYVYYRMGDPNVTNNIIDEMYRVNAVSATNITFSQTGALTGDSNTSFSFNGTTSFVPLTNTIGTALDDNNRGTYEAWIYVTSLSTTRTIIRQGQAAAGFAFRVTANGELEAWFGDLNIRAVSATGEIAINTWYHVAATWDGTNVRLYKNGALITTSADQSAFTWANVASSATDIGRVAGLNSENFSGRIDELALYRSALSGARILSHYNVGTGASSNVDVSVSAPVANIDVAGVAPTVSTQADVTQSPPVANIDVAGLAPTVTVEANISVSAPVADIAVQGNDTSISAGGALTIGAELADIAVAGLDADVTAQSDLTVAAPTADISVAALPATVGVSGNISIGATVADIAVAGLAPTIVIQIGKQFLRPVSDIGWDQNGGYGGWANVDEPSPNDDDFVSWTRASTFPDSGISSARITLNLSDPVATPNTTSGHILRYRYISYGSASVIVTLYANSLIKSWTEPTAATWTTRERTLTAAEVGAIGNYNNLRVQVGVYPDAGATGQVSWIEMELPAMSGDNTVSPPVADITVAGLTPTISISGGVTVVVDSPANVSVAALATSFSTGDTTSIGVETGNITIAGVDTGLVTDRTIAFQADVVDITMEGPAPSVWTGADQLLHRWIPDYYTGMSSKDANPLQSLDFGPLLHGQRRALRFRLGNDSHRPTDFLIRAVSSNPGVVDMIEFSPDAYTWARELVLESIPANGLTDVIWVRMSVSPNAFVSTGSFLIEVVQSVA